MAHLNINTNACVVLTNKLEKLSRSAMPLAVRETLNNAAFDMKNTTLQKSATNNFVKRSPNFFKTFSAVNKANGFNLNSMKATVGMSDRGKGKAAETAVHNMQFQENSGVVRKGLRSLRDIRAGSNDKVVRRSSYYSNMRKLIGPRLSKTQSKKSQFIANAVMAKKTGAKMKVKTDKGRFIIEIKSIKRNKKNSEQPFTIKSNALMMERKKKPSHIKATNYMAEATAMTEKKIHLFFKNAAEKQFAKVLK
jgi:hypothetical protein